MKRETLNKKTQIKPQTIKAGRYKESGTPTRQWTQEERDELNSVIQDTYDTFITDVANARKLDKKDHEVFADAHIFTARQAKEVQLIDKVATLSYAQKQLIKLSKVSDPIWKKQDKFEKFMEKVVQESVTQFLVFFQGGLKAI
ncbi:MAG: S49 family peptidase [Campylobacterota bacterium]|nr:S49 family peptidase [Campylobacterota bacterium]